MLNPGVQVAFTKFATRILPLLIAIVTVLVDTWGQVRNQGGTGHMPPESFKNISKTPKTFWLLGKTTNCGRFVPPGNISWLRPWEEEKIDITKYDITT